MRKDLGVKAYLYPQSTLVIATYNEDGSTNAMVAAWGSISDTNQVAIYVAHSHKTMPNILARKAFTVSFATEDTVVPADYVGIVSGNNTPDKFKKSGLHAEKSEFVDAPVITDFPVCMECELESYEDKHCHCFGNIINTTVDESVLTDGKIDPKKLKAIAFDIANGQYLKLGNVCAKAFGVGSKLK